MVARAIMDCDRPDVGESNGKSDEKGNKDPGLDGHSSGEGLRVGTWTALVKDRKTKVLQFADLE